MPTANEEQTLFCVAPNQLLHQLGAKVPGHSSAQHFGGNFGKLETLHPAPGEKQTKPEKGSGPVEDLEHGLWRLWNMSISVAIVILRSTLFAWQPMKLALSKKQLIRLIFVETYHICKVA